MFIKRMQDNDDHDMYNINNKSIKSILNDKIIKKENNSRS